MEPSRDACHDEWCRQAAEKYYEMSRVDRITLCRVKLRDLLEATPPEDVLPALCIYAYTLRKVVSNIALEIRVSAMGYNIEEKILAFEAPTGLLRLKVDSPIVHSALVALMNVLEEKGEEPGIR